MIKTKWNRFLRQQEKYYSPIILSGLLANMSLIVSEMDKDGEDIDSVLYRLESIIEYNLIANIIYSLFINISNRWSQIAWKETTQSANIREGVNISNIERQLKAPFSNIAIKRAREIVNTQRKQVRAIVAEMRQIGASDIEIKNAIKNNKYSKNQAILNAATQIITAANTGYFEAARQSKYEVEKTWNSQHDNRVRDPAGPINFSHYSHREVDGQTLPIDSSFNATNGEIQYPGDPNAALGNTINCRCFIEISIVRDAQGRPKLKINGISAFAPARSNVRQQIITI